MNDNGEWKRLYNEELHSFCHSPNIVRVIKSRSLRWADRSCRKVGVFSKFLTAKPTGKMGRACSQNEGR